MSKDDEIMAFILKLHENIYFQFLSIFFQSVKFRSF